MSIQSTLNTSTTKIRSRSEHKARRLLVTVLVVVMLVAFIANMLLTSAKDNRPYSPDSYMEKGSAALATLLKNEGVEVVHVTSPEQLRDVDSRTTVLVTSPTSMSDEDIATMVDADARIIVVGNTDFIDLEAWGFNGSIGLRSSRSVVADCENPAAKIADEIGPTSAGLSNPPAHSCFLLGNEAVWATSASNPKISFFGAPDIFTNKYLAERGNAAFAMHILGSQPKLFWIEGYTDFTIGAQEKDTTALPDWLIYTSIAALLSGLWLVVTRLRRFGKLVPESMPVVVPFGETQAGRARLYARGKDYPYAASILRAATIQAAASRYGLHRYSSRDDVVSAFATASRLSPPQLSDLLYTREVRSERDLQRLSADLNELTKEISHDRPSA
ncbi:hypothetical protein JOD55_000720 [Arcanobacterium pluranimalium]|uniref:DUF4350 domain-containing protein n=1 Tax=Arcanobacterium pluranimalium TaxID=108028 RepID=UPI00195CB28C|nr:DUF4350 domain-containing protein [Arcanobacterium pluranimalium]MBM7824893.1 hypothetical protein [Arcanobacterium pluranimalium]